MEWITGAAILAQSGVATPSADDTAWADACAAALNAGMHHALEGSTTIVGDEPELLWLASTAGVEAYKRREAVFGVTGFVDLQGAAVRVARDYLDAVRPILARYATFGLA